MAEIGRDIYKVKEILENSSVVGIPTETVYGLAGNALDRSAVTNIYKIKNRPSFNPLIVHTNKIEKLASFVLSVPDKALILAKRFWPGPLTLILPKKNIIPDLVTSGLNSVAIRIPDHTLTLDLLGILDFPLVAPSANPFGYLSPTKPEHVNDQLGDKIQYILDGSECKIGIESTIIGFEDQNPVIYRLGGVSVEKIESLIGETKVLPSSVSDPKAPGMLKSHYAPKKNLVIGNIEENLQKYASKQVAILSFKDPIAEFPLCRQIILSTSGDLEEAAKNLFDALRKIDKMNVKVILTEQVPDVGLGKAINDRLLRASYR